MPAMLLLVMVVVLFWGSLATAQRGFILIVILAILLSLRIASESAKRTDRMLGAYEDALDELRNMAVEMRRGSEEDERSRSSDASTDTAGNRALRLSDSSSSSQG